MKAVEQVYPFPVTPELKQVVHTGIAAGKFILIHPDYELIKTSVKLELFEDEMLEDFEVHNWQYEIGEMIPYDENELFFFYTLLELSCRIFICNIADDLKKMAIESGETNEIEFNRVRDFYLHHSQIYLHLIKRKLEGNERFAALEQKIEQLNSLV